MDTDLNYKVLKTVNTIYSIDVHPDATYFTTGHHDGIARTWNKHNPNAVVCTYSGHLDSIRVVKISSDGQ